MGKLRKWGRGMVGKSGRQKQLNLLQATNVSHQGDTKSTNHIEMIVLLSVLAPLGHH